LNLIEERQIASFREELSNSIGQKGKNLLLDEDIHIHQIAMKSQRSFYTDKFIQKTEMKIKKKLADATDHE
jgi:hypothetical protein